MSELGQMLRDARESKGISLVEAEEATRIRRKYLQALEEAQYEVLPPGVYVRGFLRSYASYLGLDPESALAAYQDGLPSSAQPAEPQIISEPLSPSSPLNWELIAGVIMLVALGAVLVLVYRQYITPLAGGFVGAPAATETSTPAATETSSLAALLATSTPTSSPTAEPTPSPTPVPPTATPTQVPQPTATLTAQAESAQQLTLTLTVTAPSWVRMVLDGDTVYEGILEPGEEQTWEAEREISMRTGNAGGLTATLNGEDIGALGESGAVRDFTWRLSDDGLLIAVTPTA